MSDVTNQDNANANQGSSTENNTKLYAGKYKSVEELSNAYENLQQKYSQTSDEKKRLEERYRAPDDYRVSATHALSENELSQVREEAKLASLNQEQFDVLVKRKSDEAINRKQRADKIREELGDEKINVLKDYVAKNYPPAIGKEMLEKVILDEKLRTEAFQHRDLTLSNTSPGIGTTSDVYAKVTKTELEELAIKVDKNPANLELRDLYLKKLGIYSKQKKQG